VQLGELRATAEEPFEPAWTVRNALAPALERRDHLGISRSGRRLWIQQRDRQISQLFRRVGAELARVRRDALELGADGRFHRQPRKRQLLGQRLIEHDADRVPVARPGQTSTRALLRRHERDRPGDFSARALAPLANGAQIVVGFVSMLLRGFHDQTEVADRDSAVGVEHQHVRWLEIAV
jgi:hypothetical protein